MVKPEQESNNNKVWIPITVVACILSVILVAWCVCRCSRDEDDHGRLGGGRMPPPDWLAVAPPRRPRGGPAGRRRRPFDLPPGAAAVAEIGGRQGVRGLPMPLPWQEVVFAAEWPIRQRPQQPWEFAPEPRPDMLPPLRQPEPVLIVREPRGVVTRAVRPDGRPRVFMDNRDLEKDAAADPLMNWRLADGLAFGHGLGMMGPVGLPRARTAVRPRSRRRRRVRFDLHPHWIEGPRPVFDHDDDEEDEEDGGVGLRANVVERRPIFD